LFLVSHPLFFLIYRSLLKNYIKPSASLVALDQPALGAGAVTTIAAWPGGLEHRMSAGGSGNSGVSGG
jgi:hypothetical protein